MASHEALARYKAKRNFSITPEPAGSGETAEGALTFVVQKHWASHLHYDFRLELGGTMKSWAVPKGPSFDSRVKRMAVQVEDHPISYSSFEGTIPKKQYGAGKVMVWDNGIWQPQGNPRKGYREGNLKFELHGHKLHGRWVLVRMKGKGEKQQPWLLIKEQDRFARPSTEFSVVDELPDSVKALPARSESGMPPEAIPAKLPAKLAPQLATLVEGPPADPADWVYEIKFDGYRLLTRIDGVDIRLFTRNGNDWTSKLVPLQKAIAALELPPGWYDGEIAVLNENNVPDFGALQQAFASNRTRDVVLYLFDLPYFEGHDLRAAPLAARRTVLQRVLQKAPSEQVRMSDVFDAPLESVIASACKMGLEGVIAKRRDSTYGSQRSANWIKLKCAQRQEFVVGGYTDPQGARTGIGSLLLGVYDAQGGLRYAGNVGTGFNERTLQDLKRKLNALATSTSPFSGSMAKGKTPHWVKPKLVAEVSFGEWTRSHHIRHAVFRGLRSDKDPKLVVREIAAGAPVSKPGPGLRVTHGERVIDASTGITKLELVRYYGLVVDLMMTHLRGRPVSLLRAPNGVEGEQFFQKHAGRGKLPGFRQLDRALSPGHPPMLEIAGKRGPLSAAQWNVVEFHTLNGASKAFRHPDRMVFDLDPGEGVPWAHVQEAAQLVHAFLQQLGLTSFLKTSGGKGLHVVVPLRRLHDWDSVKGFSRAVVVHLAKTIPQRFVAKSGPTNRVGRIFVDYLRNGLGASTICAWSARARPGMGISVPLDWSELKSVTGGDHWTVRTAHTRLDQGNDPWQGYAKAAVSLTSAMRALGHPSTLRRSRKRR